MSAKIQTSLRLDADKLAEAKQILSQLGLNFSEAVNIFTNLIVANRVCPSMSRCPTRKLKPPCWMFVQERIWKPSRLNKSNVKSVHNENPFAP